MKNPDILTSKEILICNYYYKGQCFLIDHKLLRIVTCVSSVVWTT